MKRLISIFALLVLAQCICFAQDNEDFQEWASAFQPTPKKVYKKTPGKYEVFCVKTTNLYTIVYFRADDASLIGTELSLSSNFTLKCKEMKLPLKVRSWGFGEHDAYDLIFLNFDQMYNIDQSKIFTLFMIFDPVSPTTREVSVDENKDGGIFWHGIKLEESKPLPPPPPIQAEILGIEENQ